MEVFVQTRAKFVRVNTQLFARYCMTKKNRLILLQTCAFDARLSKDRKSALSYGVDAITPSTTVACRSGRNRRVRPIKNIVLSLF